MFVVEENSSNGSERSLLIQNLAVKTVGVEHIIGDQSISLGDVFDPFLKNGTRSSFPPGLWPSATTNRTRRHKNPSPITSIDDDTTIRPPDCKAQPWNLTLLAIFTENMRRMLTESSAAKRALLRIHHACSPLSSHINQRSIATDWWSKRSFTMRWHDEFDHMLTTVAQLQWLYGSIQVETCWLAGEEIQHPVEIFAPSFKSNSCTLHYSIGSQIRCTVSS